MLWPALNLLKESTQREGRHLRYRHLGSKHERRVGELERAPTFLQLHGREHGHGCYAGDGDGEARERAVEVVLVIRRRANLVILNLDVHGNCKYLTGCFRGIGRDNSICFESYACCETSEQGW